MFKSKKSQFLILSVMILIATGIIIYSQETQNTYKSPDQENFIIDSLKKEVCGIVKITNGSNLPLVINNITNDTNKYCIKRKVECELVIINTTQVPYNGNWSKHNYTHYNYSLYYNTTGITYNSSFIC